MMMMMRSITVAITMTRRVRMMSMIIMMTMAMVSRENCNDGDWLDHIYHHGADSADDHVTEKHTFSVAS